MPTRDHIQAEIHRLKGAGQDDVGWPAPKRKDVSMEAKWDDGYLNGFKACAAIVQAAMFRAA